jgi:hypothetical protein
MTTLPSSSAVGFRGRPLARLLGAAGSWFFYSLNFTLFVYSITAVMEVGGNCASGQSAYVIAVQCPDNATAFIPWCIFGALGAIALALALGQGFGTQLIALAWPGLFCGLGALFLSSGIAEGEPVGLIIGGMFVVMGLVPLAIEFRGSVQRVFLGNVNVLGQRFVEGSRAKRSMMFPGDPNPQGAARVTVADWALAFATSVVPLVGGVLLAHAWFQTV